METYQKILWGSLTIGSVYLAETQAELFLDLPSAIKNPIASIDCISQEDVTIDNFYKFIEQPTNYNQNSNYFP